MNPFRVGWFVAILIFVVACWFFYSKLTALDSILRDQQKQIQALGEKLAARGKIDLFDLQERCSAQAERVFKSSGFKQDDRVQFTSHYNPELNKCFMLVDYTKTFPEAMIRNLTMPAAIMNDKTLSDTFERKEYANYTGRIVPDKSWNESPIVCKVTLPSGEEKVCRSREEFTALIKIYMEESADQKAGKLRSQPQK